MSTKNMKAWKSKFDHYAGPDVDEGDKVNLEDGFDGAPARVAPHVNHHREAKLAHVLAGKEISG